MKSIVQLTVATGLVAISRACWLDGNECQFVVFGLIGTMGMMRSAESVFQIHG
jgi:hypothetical protein